MWGINVTDETICGLLVGLTIGLLGGLALLTK